MPTKNQYGPYQSDWVIDPRWENLLQNDAGARTDTMPAPPATSQSYAGPPTTQDTGPAASRRTQQTTGQLPPTGTTAQGNAPPASPQPTSPSDWFWGIGTGGNADEQKIYSAVSGLDPRQGLTAAAVQAIQAVYPGATVANAASGSMNIPGIGIVDVIRNAGSDTAQWAWMPPSGGSSPASSPATAPSPSTPVTAPSVTIAGTSGGTPAGSPAYRSDLIDQLLARARQSLNVDPLNDRNIRAQADPYAAAQERAARNFVADLAERAGPYTNLTGQERVARENAAQASGGFEAQLVGRELEARRTEVQDALVQLQGIMSTEQEQALRRELGQLDAQIRQYGIDVGANTAASARDLSWQQALLQNDQFLQDLGLRAENQYNYYDTLRSGLV